MRDFYVVIDESGAKGYSNQREQWKGEFGLAAGIVFSYDKLSEIEKVCNSIRAQYEKNTGKTHITDLAPSEQENARQAVYQMIKDFDVNIVHSPIFVEGFCKANNKPSPEAESTEYRFSTHCVKESLHATLLSNVIDYAIAYCVDVAGTYDIHLYCKSDNLDEPIKKNTARITDELLNVAQEQTKAFTAFNTVTKKIEERKISIKMTSSGNCIDELEKVKVEKIVSEDTGLTFVVDVLVNSIHYFIKDYVSRQKNLSNVRLHSPNVLNDFPLKDFIYSFRNDGEICCSDSIYRYPEEVNG